MQELAGKVAIVTGAGQGVGRGIALALASAGATVVLAGRTLAKCEAVLAEIEGEGGRGLALACDVSQRADCEALVEQAVAAFGRLDILVNNAHTSRPMVGVEATRDKDASTKTKASEVEAVSSEDSRLAALEAKQAADLAGVEFAELPATATQAQRTSAEQKIVKLKLVANQKARRAGLQPPFADAGG